MPNATLRRSTSRRTGGLPGRALALAALIAPVVVSSAAFAQETSAPAVGLVRAHDAPESATSAALQRPTRTPIWLQDPWTGDTRLVLVPEPDQSLWNRARIDDYETALATGGPPPLGVLAISRLGLEVPVYNGTDEHTLDRGLGRIPGMARLDDERHLGISGHRDGFFRVLKDLQEGDRIVVRSPSKVEVYEVEGFSIVDKHDHSILHAAEDEWRLTLVTCYPFYFVGHAPERYIVHASPVRADAEAAVRTTGE